MYLKFLASDGKEALFNASALVYALANALATLAEREDNTALAKYSSRLKEALIDTVAAQGTIQHRTRRSMGCLSRDGMLHMMCKLGMCAEKKSVACAGLAALTSWRR